MAWSTATGEGQVFVGSPDAQASTRYFRVPERMPELVPVTGLASAAQAIETIVEEGEGARGNWQEAHFGRFLTMLEDYRAMLQLLYRFFQHTEETDAELSMLGETAVQMMRQVIRPLGELLSRLPVGPHAPGMTAGPSFMLTSATPVTPHKRAAWIILGERLRELAEVCDGLTGGASGVLAGVRQRLAAFAAPLGQLVPRSRSRKRASRPRRSSHPPATPPSQL